MSHTTPELHKHRDEDRMGHIQRSLNHILNVVTADLLVDFGVFLTGVVLVVFESGLVPHRPFDNSHEPARVVVVRYEDGAHDAPPEGH